MPAKWVYIFVFFYKYMGILFPKFGIGMGVNFSKSGLTLSIDCIRELLVGIIEINKNSCHIKLSHAIFGVLIGT